jgi:hypothetical protein
MPLNRKHPQVFYGWWVVGSAFFVALYMGGTIFYGFTAVFKPIAEELEWSYTQISLAASLRGLEMGLLAPGSSAYLSTVGAHGDCYSPARLLPPVG